MYIDTSVAPDCGSARNNRILRITVTITSSLQRSLAASDLPRSRSASWLPVLRSASIPPPVPPPLRDPAPQSRPVARRATTLPIPYPPAVPRRRYPFPRRCLYIEAAL